MRQFDLSPLYRSTIGFDRLFKVMDSFLPQEESYSYPPYNIERLSENEYRITMAVAGFKRDEIEISICRNQLIIKGQKIEQGEEKNQEFLHRGIASRSFERKFQLADHTEVVEAKLEHGLLAIDFKREIPQEMLARKIELKAPEEASKAVKKEIEQK